MSVTYSGAEPTTATTMTPAGSGAGEERRVILACALSSVVMVFLAAAILYFRITVLRRERTLNEIRRLEALAEHHRGRSNLSLSHRLSNSRPVSRTSSSASQLSLSSSWPRGSFQRQFSSPPRILRTELRRGSLHTIPNGFGIKATTEPLALSCDAADAVSSTKPERASSAPDADPSPKPGDPRRASWSFENPVFDQWVPPLMVPPDPDDEADADDSDVDVFAPADDSVAVANHHDNDTSFTVIDSQLSGDGVALVAKATAQEDAVPSPQAPKKQALLSRLVCYPLYSRHEEHPLSLPTLHEREDSSSSGGGNEKTTEAEATKDTDPDPNTQRDGTNVITISRGRSESSC